MKLFINSNLFLRFLNDFVYDKTKSSIEFVVLPIAETIRTFHRDYAF